MLRRPARHSATVCCRKTTQDHFAQAARVAGHAPRGHRVHRVLDGPGADLHGQAADAVGRRRVVRSASGADLTTQHSKRWPVG